MKTKVKICGIRHIESAHTAIDAGADYLGFNFVLSSKRFINPIRAKAITEKIRKKIATVGIFQNASVDDINEHIKFLKLDFVQLHGNETAEYAKKIKAEVIKVFSLPENPKLTEGYSLSDDVLQFLKHDNANYVLLDRYVQGKGELVDIEKAKIIAGKFPTFLAGGLYAGNVAEIIEQTKPFAVDVAGGIETNGVEDMGKIKMFIEKAKGI